MKFEAAVGPVFESAAAGRRASQRAVLGVPTLTFRVASWFDYAVEGHFARHVTPVTANEFGIVPIAFRVHTGGRTQVHLSGGAGVVWSGLAGIHGLEQRQNYITQLGAGVARVRADGSAVSLETRFYHLSNVGAKPPNLGMEQISVLVGYRCRGKESFSGPPATVTWLDPLVKSRRAGRQGLSNMESHDLRRSETSDVTVDFLPIHNKPSGSPGLCPGKT